MTRPVLRSAPTAHQSNGVTSGSTSSGTLAGDTVIAVQEVDFRAVGDFVAPTGGITDWQPLTAAIKFGDVAMRAWIGHAPSNGAKTVTVSQGGGNSGNHLILFPYAGDVVVDAGPTSNGGTSNATSLSVPQVDPTVTDAVLLGFWAGGGFSPNPTPAAPVTITPPASMPDSRVTARFNEFFTLVCGAQDLTSDVATGARAATTSTTTSNGWVGILLAVRATATAVTKSGSDTATGAETGYVAVPRTGGDTATGSESGSVATGQSGGDSGAGSGGTASIAGTTTGGDTATGAGTGQVSAATTAAPDSGTGTETGAIVLPGGDTAGGAAKLTQLHADVAAADAGSGAEGGWVETLFGDLVLALWAVDPDTGALIALPDYAEITLSPQRNSPGAISLRYPTDGQGFGVLREHTVEADRDLEVEIWSIGSPQAAMRAYLQEATGDDVAEGQDRVWTFAGGFCELRMGEAWVEPQPKVGVDSLGDEVAVPRDTVTQAQWDRLLALGYTGRAGDGVEQIYAPQLVVDAVKANAVSVPVLADPKRELKVAAETPGGLVGLLMAQARARGALTDIEWDFTATHDSGGTPWPQVLTTKFSPGAGYDQILGKLVELGLAEWAVEWTGTAKVLRLWVPEGRGADLTVGPRPIILRHGRNLLDAPRKWSIRESGTAVLAAGADGVYAEASSTDAQTRRGRRVEVSASAGNGLATTDAVTAYAQTALAAASDGVLEVTHGLGFAPGEPRPLIAFDVCDWIYSQSVGDRLDRLRVVQWSLTAAQAGPVTGTVTLNDAMQDWLVRLRARLTALTTGDTVVGTSQPREDTGVPDAPTGLVVGSTAFTEDTGAVYASVTAGWAAVEVNTDGTAATDVEGYRVEWSLESAPDVWNPGADVTGTTGSFTVAPATPIRVRVQARDRSGNRSAWSPHVLHLTEDDDTPPAVASAPVGSDYLGTARWTWDGLTAAGADMLTAFPDFSHVELHMSTASNFTPDAVTLVTQLYAAGTWTIADLPYGVAQFARLVAVDTRRNAAEPSAQATATPGKLVSIDFGPESVERAAIKALAVGTGEIDNLAVNDAKVMTLSAGKITAGIMSADVTVSGIFRTALTGRRVEFDNAGIRLYDAAGNATVNLKTADSSALVSGQYQTALSGARMVFNPGGTSPAESRWYPASTNQYARIRPSTSVAIGYEGQAGINMKAYSGRGDMQSGEVNVYPGLASLVWGNEMDGGSITSRIAASDVLAFIGGPRVRLSAAIGQYYGIQLSLTNSSGAIVGQSSLVLNDQGPSGLARLISDSPNGNSGIQFNDALGGFHGISVIDGTTGGLVDIYARAFKTSSARQLKTNVERDPIDVAAAIKRVALYRYAFAGQPGKQLGLMADELPPDVVSADHNGDQVVDVYGIAALAMAGVRNLITRVETIERGRST